MAATTQANVLIIAPEFSSVDAGTWTLILADVATEVSNAVYGTRQEQAQRYLAAHYLTLINSSGKQCSGPVVAESVGQVSKVYAQSLVSKSDYSSTVYGQTFLGIRKGCVVGFTVIAP